MSDMKSRRNTPRNPIAKARVTCTMHIDAREYEAKYGEQLDLQTLTAHARERMQTHMGGLADVLDETIKLEFR